MVIVSSVFFKIFIAILSLGYNAKAKLMRVFINTLQLMRGSVIGRYGRFRVNVEKRLSKSESRSNLKTIRDGRRNIETDFAYKKPKQVLSFLGHIFGVLVGNLPELAPPCHSYPQGIPRESYQMDLNNTFRCENNFHPSPLRTVKFILQFF